MSETLFAPAFEQHAHTPSLGVAGDIDERLLGNPIEGRLQVERQPPPIHPLAVKIHRHTTALRPFGRVAAQGEFQPKVVQRREDAVPRPGDGCRA